VRFRPSQLFPVFCRDSNAIHIARNGRRAKAKGGATSGGPDEILVRDQECWSEGKIQLWRRHHLGPHQSGRRGRAKRIRSNAVTTQGCAGPQSGGGPDALLTWVLGRQINYLIAFLFWQGHRAGRSAGWSSVKGASRFEPINGGGRCPRHARLYGTGLGTSREKRKINSVALVSMRPGP